jgi:subtilase family serine protease
LWNGDPGSGGTPIGSEIISTIGTGSSVQTQIDWPNVEAGTYEVYVKVDSDDVVIESDETDNKGYKSLLVTLEETKVFLPIVVKGYQ